ncbi:MAG: 50S ribosomal protein L28 [Anaerolineaceae bacterium 4572_78]|nr:MAG: 50S ribosomal protein L28 [Anaerolineaceae bacterium 4572_78]
MAKCQICNKKPLFGNNVSFSQRHTRRQWKPNIQKATVYINGQKRKMKVCAKCLKTLAKS